MALAINNVYTKANANSIASYNSGTGTGRILIVALGMTYYEDNPITNVTYGGVSLTKAVWAQSTDGGGYHYIGSEIWYTLSPATGSNAVVVTSGDNGECPVIICYVSGADTTAIGATGGKSAFASNSPNVDITPTTATSLLVGLAKSGKTGSNIYTAGAGTTLNAQVTNSDGNSALISRFSSSTSSTNLATVSTGSNDWAASAIELLLPGGAGPTTPTNLFFFA